MPAQAPVAGTRRWGGVGRTGAPWDRRPPLRWVERGQFLLVCAAAGAGFSARIVENDDGLWENFCCLT